MKVNSTTVIMNPSWGKTLELLQQHGSIRISTTDVETFKKLLDSINLQYTTIEDGILTRFTLTKSTESVTTKS